MIENYIKPYVTALVHSLDAMFDVKYTIILDDQGEPRLKETAQVNPDYKYWVCVGFHGIITGEFLLATETTDWAEILEDLVDDEEELKEMLPASLKEMLNVAAGKAVAIIQNDFPGLTLFSPKVMEGKMDYPESHFFTCFLQHEKYHPIEVTLCINTMQQKLGVKLEEEIKRRAMEVARAQKAEETMKSIMRHTIHGVCLVDPNGVILPGASQQLGNLFFKPLSEIEDHNLVDVCPPELMRKRQKVFLRWLKKYSATSGQDQDLLSICPFRTEERFKIGSIEYTYELDFVALPGKSTEVMITLVDKTVESELRRRNVDLLQKANTDELTKLANRRFFMSTLENEISISFRENRPLSVIMCDIDHFKKFNDTYGHQLGDEVLRVTADTLKKNIRLVEDLCGRYGGEEFIFSLPGTDVEKACQVAEKLRKAVEGRKVEWEEQQLSVTISLGVSTLEFTEEETMETLINRADQGLYQAKENGRNQVMAN